MDRQRVNVSKSSFNPKAVSTNEELAATRIQAGFRGYLARKEHPTRHTTSGTHIPNVKSGSMQHSRLTDPHELTPVTAATRIQATYRGYHTRKRLADDPHHATSHGVTTTEGNALQPDAAAAKIQAGFRGYRTRRELKAKNKYPMTTTVNRSDGTHWDPDYAATRIQATFRGYQTRRALHGDNQGFGVDKKTPLRTQNHSSQLLDHSHLDTHSRGHDLLGNEKTTKFEKKYHPAEYSQYTHPDGTTFAVGQVNKENADLAATRIQAAYRGFATRKHLHRTGKQPTDAGVNQSISHNSRYTDPSEAATKIQATFRGYKTRQHLQHRPSTNNSTSHHT